MSRVSEILLRARDTLGDTKKERWSDARLIRLIDDGQKDICRRAKLLRTSTDLLIVDGIATYAMPDDFLLLDKVDINNTRTPLIGHTELDKRLSEWVTHKGKPQFIVYDKQDRGRLRVYPIPDFNNSSRFIPVNAYQSYRYSKVTDRYGCIINAPAPSEFPTGVYGFTTSIHGVFQYMEGEMPKVFHAEYPSSSLFGVVSDISISESPNVPKPIIGGEISAIEGFKNKQNFGIVVGFEAGKDVDVRVGDNVGIYFEGNGGYYSSFKNTGEIMQIDGADGDAFGFITRFQGKEEVDIKFDSLYGLTTGVTANENVMTIYYLRKPKPVTDIDSEIEIDDSFDKALKYYVVGMAFRDDLDTQNRSVGNEELKLYERELEQAYNDDASDFTRNDFSQYETAYNGWGF